MGEVKKKIDNNIIVKALMNTGTTMFVIYWILIAFMELHWSMFLLQVVGSGLWVYVGYRWKDPSVWFMHGYVGIASFISLFVYWS